MDPSRQPLCEQDENITLNQLLVDAFDKVGKASGAGGLEMSKWAVKDGETLSPYGYRSNPVQHHNNQPQPQEQQQQSQFSNGASLRTGSCVSYIGPQNNQQQTLSSPQHYKYENGYGRDHIGAGGGIHGAASTSFTTTASTRDRDGTGILRVRDVDMDVDMGSLHALVGQCIDPGLERIVDVWEVGDTFRTVTLHFSSTGKAMLFSSLLGRLHSWSRYNVDHVPPLDPQKNCM
ncbi:predicted protein [Histoplasma capsulatum var. duboisii H88]|uniref:Predicted protein n=1 Tax=Ajellomyces capsulatus (strain H88) TaxID=544711 RepID=F0UNC5_AJEC8|nr:predicted protein [Histoplasma capsulatum var. duboisii H88]QSS53748.1 hypothetical protein I7I53_01107 [Histoplasma capsulatum var. duboisii H88]